MLWFVKLYVYLLTELVDCDKIDEGCNGGLPIVAYKEIMRLGGLESEGDYPYEAKDDKCEFKKSDVRVKITGAVNISHNEEGERPNYKTAIKC